MSNPRPACSLVQVVYKLTTCPYFDKLKFDIFDTGGPLCHFIMSVLHAGRHPMSADTFGGKLCTIWFLPFFHWHWTCPSKRSIGNLSEGKAINEPTKLIKLTKFVLAPVLTRIFNKCIIEGFYPDWLEVAEVIYLQIWRTEYLLKL